MVEAIFYVLRTAVAWRDLPACFGPWESVYTRWRRWCAPRVCGRRFCACSRAGPRVACALSTAPTSSCTSSRPIPAGGQAAQAIGSTKGGLNTKIAALVEGRGRLMAGGDCSRTSRRSQNRRGPTARARPGGLGNFIASVIRSKTFSSASKSISAFPLAMKNSPSPSSTLFSCRSHRLAQIILKTRHRLNKSKNDQLNAFCDYLAKRRKLFCWLGGKPLALIPDKRTAHSLTCSQFNAHIPEVLDAFENKLRSRPVVERKTGQQTSRKSMRRSSAAYIAGNRITDCRTHARVGTPSPLFAMPLLAKPASISRNGTKSMVL